MKISQRRLKHSTFRTCVTVGEGKDKKEFQLLPLENGQFRVYTPFGGSTFQDFSSREAALEHCQQ